MKPYYECHITFEGDNGEAIVKSLGWAYSRIDGDPVMGKGVRQYAIIQANQRNPQDQVAKLLMATANAMRERGLKVTRIKIELVLFDQRTAQ